MFLHIDIDSFFASAERAVNPDLEGRPIAVGGRSNLEIFNRERTHIKLMNENSGAFVTPVFYSDREKCFDSFFVDRIDNRRKIRGIITTASYEARAFGVKTAMPIAQAMQLCPELIVIPSNYRLYHQLSQEVNRFMQEHIPKVEQFSIDEFFGDLSGWVEEDAVYTFALTLRNQIKERFGLPVSIGIASSKWIAKLATEFAKPFDIYQVHNINAFIRDIPIEAFPGIGRGFQQRLREHNIQTLGEVAAQQALFSTWKKPGMQLYQRILGIDHEPISAKGERKSIGISRTFDPIYDREEIRRRVMIMARHIAYMVLAKGINPSTYYLKIRYEYGIKRKTTRTVDRLFSEALFKEELLSMYREIAYQGSGAIKVTVNVSNFMEQHIKTLSLFDLEADRKKVHLTHNIQSLRNRFGLDIVKSGCEL